ncbi:PTS lactose/cellobiose transporter subunit IIA [Bacillus wiedmannii]|uniref:PTS lactose/cellobiose transporter subunit IIA n=1 Tax=Bacillus wiedmannii TaxID=1890302 RepID=UPI00027AB66A|nr:PTS lactose/cellobiose transporter subunit IIA [Bacillus wiedmannii]EJS64156.1 PTS system, lactose-specific IIa component [Bacillus wiedmannii]OOR28345.1 PTS lactose/cellobiose transporter subunit IIA [Bacillus wiedmannii]
MIDMQTPFALILHGGNARSAALEAIAFARQGDFENASEKMTLASEEISAAHRIQTDLIQEEARGNHAEISLLLVHAQDHLMNAITVKELAEEFITLHKRVEEKVTV